MFSNIKRRMGPIELTEERRSFIKKVYVHLFWAIMAFVAVEYVMFQTGFAQKIAAPLMSKWWLTLGAFVILGWIASYAAARARSKSAQYGALLAYVVLEAIIFAPLLLVLTQYSDANLLSTVGYITAAAVAGLTAVVWFSGQKFSFLRSLLMYGGVIALVLIFASFIFPISLGLWFSIAMVALAGAAILYDTSAIIHDYPTDRYVGAALNLFASVAMLFWYIARIFLSRD